MATSTRPAESWVYFNYVLKHFQGIWGPEYLSADRHLRKPKWSAASSPAVGSISKCTSLPLLFSISWSEWPLLRSSVGPFTNAYLIRQLQTPKHHTHPFRWLLLEILVFRWSWTRSLSCLSFHFLFSLNPVLAALHFPSFNFSHLMLYSDPMEGLLVSHSKCFLIDLKVKVRGEKRGCVSFPGLEAVKWWEIMFHG